MVSISVNPCLVRLERDVRRSVDGCLKVIEQLSLFIVSVYTDDSFHKMSSSNKGGLISESISIRLHLPNILPITSLSIFSLERNTQNKDFAQIKFWRMEKLSRIKPPLLDRLNLEYLLIFVLLRS